VIPAREAVPPARNTKKTRPEETRAWPKLLQRCNALYRELRKGGENSGLYVFFLSLPVSNQTSPAKLWKVFGNNNHRLKESVVLADF
jgi:hypothetical protein